MERKEIKGRRPEFCPSCSRVMMSYVNTMQDFLDKVVEEIEGNTPSSRRDSVSTRTLIRDLSDVRKRLPSRRGQISRATTSSTDVSEPRNQIRSVLHQEYTGDQSKSEPIKKDEQISSQHIDKQILSEPIKDEHTSPLPIKDEHISPQRTIKDEHISPQRTIKDEHISPQRTIKDEHISSQRTIKDEQISSQHIKENVRTFQTNVHEVHENAEILKDELIQLRYDSNSNHDFANKDDEKNNIQSSSLNKSYEIHCQGHVPNKETCALAGLNETLQEASDQNSEFSSQTNIATSFDSTQKFPERNGFVENQQKCENSLDHRREGVDPQTSHIEDIRPQPVPNEGQHTPSIDEVSPMVNIEPPSPEVPLPPTWVENMLNICDIPLLLPPASEMEAYVTMATNNLTAIGAMVLGNSLRLSNTTKTLAVLIADEVTEELRNVLASVFHVVQRISSLEPMGSTKLALLEQPELGITYSKLLVWRLTQFDKCVFLSPDTLVIQNCDELFERNEISAVPDVGWPDCFNTAVFVFTPSDETFWNLVDFAQTKGSFDGGDQGLLNMYFRSWSLDIHKRLPFIYNLMANVSYTYGPAFVKFGGNAKVVHFFGTTKPWNVQFNVITGQLAPFSGVHPTFSSYVQYWLTIFARCVLPLFSQDVQEYSTSHNYVNALDLARIVTGSSDAIFFFSPPSFRRYLDSSEPVAFPIEKVQNTVLVRMEEREESSNSEPEEESPTIEKSEEEEKDESLKDYNRMLAWEQGRMDYLGQDSSDNVLKRLDHAIRKGDRLS